MQHVADNGHRQLLEAVIGRALVAADREQVEQTLRRTRVAAIAGIEDRHTRCSMFGEKVRRTGGLVTDDEHVGLHRFQGLECVEQRFALGGRRGGNRSEEHTSELQSLMRISYAVFCLKKKNTTKTKPNVT